MHQKCHLDWAKLNPNHTIIWLDNNNVEKFIASCGPRITNAYNKLIPGAYKADLFRAIVLYRFGGVYIDSYSSPDISLALALRDCWNKGNIQFISILERQFYGIHNGVIVASPEHPFLNQYLTDMLENIENDFYGSTPLDITGPVCLHKSVNKVLNINCAKHKLGHNDYGLLSFYLFRLGNDLNQTVFKNDTVFFWKKYSVWHYIWQKVFCYNSTYTKLWLNKNVYIESNTKPAEHKLIK
jgi:mannosyltransferase OCH1-like enzyme